MKSEESSSHINSLHSTGEVMYSPSLESGKTKLKREQVDFRFFLSQFILMIVSSKISLCVNPKGGGWGKEFSYQIESG